MNTEILKFTDVETKVLPIEEAKQLGAMMLFGEKYGDSVRVVDVPGFSMEFCGGTHVANIGQIGSLHIVSEQGVAAGTRRITAVTGSAVNAMLALISHARTGNPDSLRPFLNVQVQLWLRELRRKRSPGRKWTACIL